MFTYCIEDLGSISRTAQHVFNDWKQYKHWAFFAEMGAGKTTFIQALLNQMNIENTQGSPTYSIVHSYESPTYGAIYHLDCYRLETEQDAYEIGLEEMLDSQAYCLIEWPEKISSFLLPETLHIEIKLKEESLTRILTVKVPK